MFKNIAIRPLKTLVKDFRKDTIEPGDHILSVRFSDLGTGSITERRVEIPREENVLSYKERNKEYVSIQYNMEHVMYWTHDFVGEPYNRQGTGYVPYSWKSFGEPCGSHQGITLYELYRTGGNISFPVWGFSVNNFWGNVTFGMVVDADDVEWVKDKIIELLGAFQ